MVHSKHSQIIRIPCALHFMSTLKYGEKLISLLASLLTLAMELCRLCHEHGYRKAPIRFMHERTGIILFSQLPWTGERLQQASISNAHPVCPYRQDHSVYECEITLFQEIGINLAIAENNSTSWNFKYCMWAMKKYCHSSPEKKNKHQKQPRKKVAHGGSLYLDLPITLLMIRMLLQTQISIGKGEIIMHRENFWAGHTLFQAPSLVSADLWRCSDLIL